MELEHGQIDGAYINTLVNFVNWCNCYGVKIDGVRYTDIPQSPTCAVKTA